MSIGTDPVQRGRERLSYFLQKLVVGLNDGLATEHGDRKLDLPFLKNDLDHRPRLPLEGPALHGNRIPQLETDLNLGLGLFLADTGPPSNASHRGKLWLCP